MLGASPESSGQKRTARGKNCSAVERHSRVTGRLEVSHVEVGEDCQHHNLATGGDMERGGKGRRIGCQDSCPSVLKSIQCL